MQAAVQYHVDNAVSKTVNLPGHAGVEEISRIFLLARSLGCKGVTIYRYTVRRIRYSHGAVKCAGLLCDRVQFRCSPSNWYPQ